MFLYMFLYMPLYIPLEQIYRVDVQGFFQPQAGKTLDDGGCAALVWVWIWGMDESMDESMELRSIGEVQG